MAQHPLFPLAIPGQSATLLLTPCPGTAGPDLEASVAIIKAAGAKAVLTLMSEHELQQNAVEALPELCRQNGLAFFHLPIADDAAPAADFADCWQQARSKVHPLLDKGYAVAIHCKGGSGRTGLMAGQILIERGLAVAEAMTLVRSVRPKAFQHKVQCDYVAQLAGAAQI